MTRVIPVVLAAAVLFGCGKKEEPKPQFQFPVGQPQSGMPMAPGMGSPVQNEVNLLKEAIRQDPKNLSALIKLGNIQMDTGQYAEAIDAYSTALEIDPKNTDVHVDMGTCYRNIGKHDIAVKEYRKALELNPNHLNGHRNLGVVLAYDLKDYPQAVKEFEAVLRIAPNHPDAALLKQEIEKFRAMKK